jgi:hypothetical protein
MCTTCAAIARSETTSNPTNSKEANPATAVFAIAARTSGLAKYLARSKMSEDGKNAGNEVVALLAIIGAFALFVWLFSAFSDSGTLVLRIGVLIAGCIIVFGILPSVFKK